MNKCGISIVLICLCILSLAVNLVMISPAMAILSQSNADSSPVVFQDDAEKIELTCQYPVLSSYAGVNYSWDISVLYSGGKEPRTFDLKATIPEGFKAQITPGYGGTGGEIAAIRLDPTKSYPESIKLVVVPYVWQVPTPGNYPISFEVSSGDIKSSINLTAIVTVNYDMKITTPDGRLNTEATAGQDSNFTVVINNTGSGNLEKVTVESRSTNRPSGWTVTFNPEKIESLPAGESKEVQVTIRPTEKTIAGDYMLSVEAQPEAKNAYGNLQIRVTALTPTIWGWVGVGIVVLVVLLLAVMFIRFGRR